MLYRLHLLLGISERIVPHERCLDSLPESTVMSSGGSPSPLAITILYPIVRGDRVAN